ncbi:AlpA family phage regulatory protein [Rhodanobacter sp. IGA1.0]|uniref:AlpA family phage regulatory protein n=1 Tax=Rhodanobacter sp. IGA1.0 TaxID=3158582 RepID=A0AAU7QK65_9GAMM
MSNQPSTRFRILRRPTVEKALGIGRSTLYSYGDPKSSQFKPDFPRPVRLGGSVGFLEHEIEEYIKGLMQAREGVARR